jgi:hydrogenase nickel incorporation protein HypA/HybF
MHELPITQNILKIALQYGLKSSATRITDLYLVIGQLSSVIDESIQFYWPIISKGTLAEDATLHFRRIPAKLGCTECGTEYYIKDGNLSTCPNCDSSQIKILEGKEFQLESIGIDDQE